MHAINRDLRARLAAALITLLLPPVTMAGSLDAPAAPTAAGGQMYTLEDLYNRIDTGATATKASSFTEPSAGPSAGTQHSLDDIYTLVGERNQVMQTEQTTCKEFPLNVIDCAGTGQDGETQAGMAYPANRFIDNGDGTVTDTLTQLIWLRDTGCSTISGTYTEGLAAIASLKDGQCSLTDGSQAGDWRMANIRELLSIAYFGDAATPLYDLFPPDSPFVKSVPFSMAIGSSTLISAGTAVYVLELLPKVSAVSFSSEPSIFHMAVRGGL